MNCLDVSRQIDAFVDAELDAPTAVAMRAHVDGCAACQQLAGERLALGRLLHAVPHYTASNRLRAAVIAATRRRQSVRRQMVTWAAAAAVAIVTVGTTAVKIVGERRATAAVAAQVVADQIQALEAQHLIDVVSSDQHTVKPWFLGKLDFSPPVEDLAAAGFPLAGGRVDRIGARSVAVLIYHRRLHPIAVFVWPQSDNLAAPVDSRTIRGFHVRHWIKDGMAFWAVSDVNADELTTFSRMLGE